MTGPTETERGWLLATAAAIAVPTIGLSSSSCTGSMADPAPSLEPYYDEVSCEGTTCRIGQPLIDALLSSPEAALAEGTSLSFARQDGRVVGLRLHGVEPEGLADRLGLREDDLVVQANGLPLTTEAELLHAVHAASEVEEVSVLLRRDGRLYERRFVRVR